MNNLKPRPQAIPFARIDPVDTDPGPSDPVEPTNPVDPVPVDQADATKPIGPKEKNDFSSAGS